MDLNPFHYLFPADDPMYNYDPFSEANNGIVKWFNDVRDYWGSPRGQYEARVILDKLTFGMLTHDENMREMDNTLKFYGLTWDYVLKGYLSKTLGWNSGRSYVTGLNYVSKNIGRLYR